MLKNFVKNPFHKPNVGIQKFATFVLTTIERLKKNNKNGIYDALINGLEPLYSDLTGFISGENVEIAERGGKTLSVDDAIANFKSFVSDNEDYISYKLNKKSADYKEVFPAGLSEYNKVNKKNFEVLSTRFLNITKKYKSKLGTDFISKVQAVATPFEGLRKKQLQNISGVKSQSGNILQTRLLLEKQLQKTLFNLLLIHTENLHVIHDFFDTSLISTHKKNIKLPQNNPVV